MPEILTRRQAVATGAKRYFTGKPCVHGHVSERRTSDRQCLACCRIKDRTRWWVDHDRKLAQRREWYRENRESVLELSKAYLRANREAISQRRRARWHANGEANRENQRARYAANPDLWKTHARLRRARMKGAEGKHTPDDVARILEAQGHRCVYCDADLHDGYHIDHIVPLIRGGTDWPDNLQCLCAPCNLSKHDIMPDEFERRIALREAA